MINKPYIRRLGTIDVDLVETTPLVIGDTLYRFEYIRGGKQKYWDNQTDNSYFRFKDVFHNTVTPSFAAGYHFGSAFHENGVTYVYGVNDHPGSDTISVFRSTDLEHWESKVALHLPGWQLFNTSVCRGKDGYVMAFEMGAPSEECGVPFTMYFALSDDAWNWTMASKECVHSKDRYTACPVIRYLPEDDYYYMIYLEQIPAWGFVPYIARSHNLKEWELSPVNPVIMFDDAEDKKIANFNLTREQQKRIEEALDVNNSDVDLCEYKGRTLINYSWGNQMGVEHLAEAVYDGPLSDFLRGFFE